MKLMGVDVGYSEVRRTTGIACLDGDRLRLGRAFKTWESREAQIPSGFQPSVIALDGPLLPQGALKGLRAGSARGHRLPGSTLAFKHA